MDIDLQESVFQFTSRELAVKREQLTLNTCLSHDLRIAGDDGYDFMVAFRDEYKVDLTDFSLEFYFGSESGCFFPLAPFIYLYWWLFKPEQLKQPRITIQDLVNAANTKKWQERSENLA